MTKCRVAIIHNIISPYRIPLFEGLAHNPSIDLSVYFCSKIHKERNWDVLNSNAYHYEILAGMTLEYYGIIYHFNPSIISRLIHEKYDVVIIGGSTDFTTQAAFVVSKKFNIPIILWSEGIESAQSFLGKLISPLTRHIVKNVNSIIVPGKISRDFHIKMGGTPEKIFLAPNIVDNDILIKKSLKFKEEKDKFKLKFNISNFKIILFIGQLIERKGVEYLIKAYERLTYVSRDKKICLIIVGDGAIKNKLEKICNERKIENVFFTGWISEEEKIIYYSIADLFVLPTLEDLCPLVINEAMACGLPVISTFAAGCAVDMIIPGENGFIVNAVSVDQLYLAVKEIISDCDLSEKMGKKSLEIIQKDFSIDKVVNGFISSIEYAISKNSEVSN